MAGERFHDHSAAGIGDTYGFIQVTLPHDIPVRAVYHSFEADSGGADFGQKFDCLVSKKFGKDWIITAKYAHYDGKDAPVALTWMRFGCSWNSNSEIWPNREFSLEYNRFWASGLFDLLNEGLKK